MSTLPCPTPPSTAAARPIAARGWWPRRSARVIALVVAIFAVSVTDLYLTILYLRHGGMGESNPIARWVIQMNCAWLLSCWKLALVGGACTILLATRRRWSAEVGAWVGAAVMVWLGLHWANYVEAVHHLPVSTSVLADYRSPEWVQFGE